MLRWVGILAVLALGWAAAAEDPLELKPSDDTYLTPDVSGKPGGRGARDEFQIYGGADKKQFRALLKFDLSEVKTAPTQAILSIYVWNIGSPKKSETIRCHPVLRDWDEKSASWDMCHADDLWTNPGGDFDPVALAGNMVANTMGGQKGWWLDFDVTPMVQMWVAKRKPNYGFALLFDPDCTAEVRVKSKEGNPAPKLQLAWAAKLDRGQGMIPGNKLRPYGDPVKMEPVLNAGGLNMVRVGEKFSQTIKARGGAKPYKFSATGLPEGVALGEDGVLAGTLEKEGRFGFSVTCAGADGKRATLRYELVAQKGGVAEVAGGGDNPPAKKPEDAQKTKAGGLEDE
ncbi:MAG: DNRLRE domain-containing protein [Planctomycetota bacterium]|nr:DNRLRE domain-containing protein [Planctomycetota bacterium]